MTWPTEQTFDALTDLRVRTPEFVLELARKRKRRADFTRSGKLNLLAADHPGRGLVKVRGVELMSDRHDMLRRVVDVLSAPSVDGVMATMDVLEELLLLDHLGTNEGRNSFLDERLLIASINRGGIAGSAWELSDPPTGANAQTIREYGLDGAKVLFRFDPQDRDTLPTLRGVSEIVRDMNSGHVPTFLEPLPATSASGKLELQLDASSIARLIGICSALGDSSRYLWLKLPFCEEFDIVARSTTLPIVLLGGPASDNIESFFANITGALDANSNVRGVMLGRNVLYPPALPGRNVALMPAEIAEVIGSVVHERCGTGDALKRLAELADLREAQAS